MSFMIVTWDQFITTNIDSRGIRYKFEDLCRQLFNNEFLSKNKITRYVHCNPNNPGLESDPVYDETNQRWIGYQAKFFDDKPGYNQILHSARKIVEKYAGKVNHIFLYSNKQLSIDAANYQKAVNLLNSANISLELVTGDTILDQVRKYPYLATYYFGSHPITHDWIIKHNERMFSELGRRFNKKFNVDTDFSHQLSLFVNNEHAIKYINEKKKKLIVKIDSLEYHYEQYNDYIDLIKKTVQNMEDIDYANIIDCFNWESEINAVVKKEKEILKSVKVELKNNRNKYYTDAFINDTLSTQEKDIAKRNYFDIIRKIESIDTLLNLPDILSISELERQMITGKILAVTGEAGIGKSHMLANEVQSLNRHNVDALLLLAGLYFTDEPIQEQIMKNCELNFSFNDLIDILEAMGRSQGKFVPVFIDALNETWNTALWKKHLPVIIDKIEECNYVKLIFSFRSEYKHQLINQTLMDRISSRSICHIIHKGFERNGIDAAKQFFDYYEIPFTLFEYFSCEMQNPLFLTLYCLTYKGGEINLSTLYERLISNANENIHKSMTEVLRIKGYSGNEDLLTPFINELAYSFVSRNMKSITKEELSSLNYWNLYGITAPPFIQQIIREHILHSYIHEEKERLYFAYDQMNDYFCAKTIIKQAESKDCIRNKILNNILQIQEGKIFRFENIDLFINVCALYASKFGEECIDLIDEVTDRYFKNSIIIRYIESFLWRDKHSISAQEFLNLIIKYNLNPECVWKVLIGNSIKIDHPLNADFLHGLLMRYELNIRDYMWTTYINTIFSDNTNRVTQLIQMYNKGEALVMTSNKQTELLLTLLGWLLTASDRRLRDYTSKAMVELMKVDFDLCEIILKKFENVNDPYITQRLYGVVFGACCKRSENWNDEHISLSEYIYITIFSQETVYPDILLRDYARLIIEHFLLEHPDYNGIIDRNKIIPPYTSIPIPLVSEDYTKVKFNGGLRKICMSMRFEGMGMYGDFGRYVFQSALRSFDVDHKHIYNYAISFIINDLGYKESLFDDYDCSILNYNYDRHSTKKLERIGKKYQWIAMYNILARISDCAKMKNRYSISDNEEILFEGAWEPYVRDFDPTLNRTFMACEDAPVFKQIDKFISDAQEENQQTTILNDELRKDWVKNKGLFLKKLKDTVILTDENGLKWVLLTNFLDTGRQNLQTTKLCVWSWMYAYFVTPEQEKEFARCAENGVDLRIDELTFFNETYTVFNREYPWSPSCSTLKKYAWRDIHIPTGDKETIRIPDFSEIEYNGVIVEKEVEKEVEENIGKILHASSDISWEEGFDASTPETMSWSVPCAELIETLHLRQLKNDGFYYDEAGKLATFDTNITQQNGGVIIRKDLLDTFLKENKMKLIWVLNANKEIQDTDSLSLWSEWTGLLSYDGTNIKENIYKIKE